MNEYIHEKLQNLITHCLADFNLAESAYCLICAAPTPVRPKLLQEFLYGFCCTPTEGDIELPGVLPLEEEKKLVHEYLPRVGRYISHIAEGNPTEEEFYEKLWQYIETDDCLDRPYARPAAMFICAAFDARIPYSHVDTQSAMTMDHETYRKMMDDISPEVWHKLDFVLAHPFQQKTQRASIVLKMLEDCGDTEHKCVFLSKLISDMQGQISRLRMQLLREKMDHALVRMVDDLDEISGDDDDDDDDDDDGVEDLD